MPPKKFLYSVWYSLRPALYVAVFGPLSYFNHQRSVKLGSDLRYFSPWTWYGTVLIIFALYIIYDCFKFLLPMLRGKAVIELDNEKIDFRHKNKLIYWNDVEKITYGELLDAVVFKLNNGKKVRIYLNCVKGDNAEIYQTILSYYKQATDKIT
ncbi:MAG TPA: hypothetical protein VK668_19445 [Mucilaginibacter sp.]|nr:hypothetical protein [Mucilaginibacter sp.]